MSPKRTSVASAPKSLWHFPLPCSILRGVLPAGDVRSFLDWIQKPRLGPKPPPWSR